MKWITAILAILLLIFKATEWERLQHRTWADYVGMIIIILLCTSVVYFWR